MKNDSIDLKKLRLARESAGFSLSSAATALRTSKFSVYSYEKNRIAMPASILFRMCKLYGITPNDLMITEKGDVA